MNSKILVLTSLLIALLCHLVLFNLFTFVFPIDPADPKPKFFFLGPILSHNEFRQISSKKKNPLPYKIFRNFSAVDNDLTNSDSGSTDQMINPFAIQTIKKPLLSQTTESQNKIVIKSTFETHLEESAGKESEAQPVDPVLKIEPYRPLQFRSP